MVRNKKEPCAIYSLSLISQRKLTDERVRKK